MTVDRSEFPVGLVDAGAQAQDVLRRADGKAVTLLQLVGGALAVGLLLTGLFSFVVVLAVIV